MTLLFIASSIILMTVSLLWAAIIDLRERLLPNELIVAFLIGACTFHVATNFMFLTYVQMLIGGVGAFILMAFIRYASNKYYGTDAFGMGDVKLLVAAGVFFGIYDFMLVLVIGAAAGIAHGVLLAMIDWKKTGRWSGITKMSLPAGPGFITGIFITAALVFGPVLRLLLG